MKRALSVLFLLVVLGGCRSAVPSVPTSERTAAELAGTLWLAGGKEWSIRQTALFELRGARLPMSGLLLLEDGGRQARIAGLNDLGVKLFEISVRPDGEEVHFLLPALARFPGAGQSVAASVRRIFLAPRPAAADRFRSRRDGIVLTRAAAGREVEFLFGGAAADLVQTQVRGDEEDWRVRYYDYREEEGSRVPGRIVLDDFAADYRLTLWLEKVRGS